MKRTLLITLLYFFCLNLSGQSPLVWEKFYDHNGDERIEDISVCKDGSILFSGFSTYTSKTSATLHAWCGKVNSLGEKTWTGKMNFSKLNSGNAIIPVTEGRSFLVGYSENEDLSINGSAFYVWIESDGTFSSPKYYGEKGKHYDFKVMMKCSDGTILVGGMAAKNMLLIRFSSEGEILSSNSFWFDYPGIISNFKEKANGNIIVVGGLYAEDKDMLLFEVDKGLNLLWKKTINKTYLESIQSVCITKDGGYIVSGTHYYRTTRKTIGWYAKLNNAGETVWEHETGEFTLENDDIKIIEYGFGRYALGMNCYGKSLGENISKNHDVRFIVFDETGKTLWEYSYETPKIEYFYDLELGEDMTLLAAGQLLENDTTSNGFIYCFKPPLSAPGIPLYVLSKEDSKPIQGATITVKHENGVIEQLTTAETGVAFIILKREERCTIQIEALGYQSLTDAVSLPAEGVKQENKYYLVTAKPGTNVVMKTVGFERSTTKLLPGSYDELDRLAQFMIAHTEMKIELSGHTDNGGVAKANQLLSEQRVEVVKNYLVEKGVAAERIKGRGYGGRKPIAPNDTEENKSKNRRVEVKLL